MRPKSWLRTYLWSTVALTYGLIVFGSLVTSNRAGLAVPDWPTTFNYSMFAYPIERWVGGVFYEHVHRLIASGVGLLALGAAIWVHAARRRWSMRWLSLAAVLAVMGQGVLGGLTVLQELPASLSIAHAAVGQGFLCLMIGLALMSSPTWQRGELVPPPLRVLPWLALATTTAIFLQLLLGASLRHADRALLAHIGGAVLALVCASLLTVWSVTAARPRMVFWQALWVEGVLVVQLLVGLMVLAVRVPKTAAALLTPWQIWLPSLHVALGALVLGYSFALTLVLFRSHALGRQTAQA